MESSMFAQIISVLTVIATLSVKIIGVPAQIRKIHQTGSIENISILYFSLSFSSYVLWTIHGVLEQDYVIIVGQGIGIVSSGTLLFLLIYHCRRSRLVEDSRGT